MSIRRGDIYYADLNPAVGSEQGGRRPVIVIQNNLGNKYGPTVIVAVMTLSEKKPQLVTHVVIPKLGRMRENSLALLEQMRTLDKSRLGEYIGHVEPDTMENIKTAILASLDLG